MAKTYITLTDETAQGFIAQQIESGEFDNADDAVNAAVRRVALYHQKHTAWNSMIDEGIADAERGAMVDGETFLRSRIDLLKKQQ